jgi:hypothetical protein
MCSDLTAGSLAPDRMPTAISAGSSSQAPSAAALSMTSDANMAWFLAVAADVCLTGHQRTMTFVELGCGEYHLAIERILNAIMSSRMTLSVAIFDRLTRWLDGYAGSLEEPRLRTMFAEIRTRQCQPVPLRTQPAQGVDVGRTSQHLRAGLASREQATYEPAALNTRSTCDPRLPQESGRDWRVEP